MPFNKNDDSDESVFAANEEARLWDEIESRSSRKIKVSVKPQVPLTELAAPLLAKWGK